MPTFFFCDNFNTMSTYFHILAATITTVLATDYANKNFICTVRHYGPKHILTPLVCHASRCDSAADLWGWHGWMMTDGCRSRVQLHGRFRSSSVCHLDLAPAHQPCQYYPHSRHYIRLLLLPIYQSCRSFSVFFQQLVYVALFQPQSRINFVPL